MKKILLLSMPFGAIERPALGLSLLEAQLDRLGFECDIQYFTFALAEFVGLEDYQWISGDLPYTAFAGDWVFTESLYGPRPDEDAEYIQTVLRDSWRLDDSSIDRILQIRSWVEPFLDHCLSTVNWKQYAVVGFTSTFEQNIASLALARRIKSRFRRMVTIFGGANWEADMGCELHRQFPFVDYVCSGEAETSLPMLLEAILRRRRTNAALRKIKGIVYRDGEKSVFTGNPEPVRHLDELPVPDYGAYFRDLDQSTVASSVAPTLLFETARGCWWGAVSHCTFCGLNGGAMAFRSKSAPRVLEELEFLVDRWRTDQVEVVDNILDMKYFNSVLPALAKSKRKVHLFYEIKANLSREQVRLLRDAGVDRVQPGIESMSDHILALMRKGTTALRNIQLLKWCREYGVAADWNILYGFPGETRDDYRRQLELLKAIRFVGPPVAWGPIRLDRFSPYFNTPQEFGFMNLRPIAPIRHLYPFDDASLGRIAYYFDFDYAPEVDPSGFATEVIQFAEEWRNRPEPGELRSEVRADGALRLVDTRSDAACREVVLRGSKKAVYEYCDELRSVDSIQRHLRDTFSGETIEESRLMDFLNAAVANRIMVTDGRYFLSLALGPPMDVNEAKPPGFVSENAGEAPLPESRGARPPLELTVLSA